MRLVPLFKRMEKFERSRVELPFSIFVARGNASIVIAPAIDIFGTTILIFPKFRATRIEIMPNDLKLFRNEEWASVSVDNNGRILLQSRIINSRGARVEVLPNQRDVNVYNNFMKFVIAKTEKGSQTYESNEIQTELLEDTVVICPSKSCNAKKVASKVLQNGKKLLTANYTCRICLVLDIPLVPDEKVCRDFIVKTT